MKQEKSMYQTETSGALKMFNRISESFTGIVIAYALHDKALLAQIAEEKEKKNISFLVENWYYSQVPVLANDMFNDIMARGSGFVRLEKVVDCLMNFKGDEGNENAKV